MRRIRLPASLMAAVAWIGLALMTASLVQLMRVVTGSFPSATGTKRAEPFTMVVIDPGHGGQDSGAIVGGMAEKGFDPRRGGAAGASSGRTGNWNRPDQTSRCLYLVS